MNITLATIADAPWESLQDIFNQSAKHLLTQNKKSMLWDDPEAVSCAYRSPSGLKCAAGIFISDEEYKVSMEGKSIDVLLPASNATQLLIALQITHDNSDPSQWAKDLDAVAASFALKPYR